MQLATVNCSIVFSTEKGTEREKRERIGKDFVEYEKVEAGAI